MIDTHYSRGRKRPSRHTRLGKQLLRNYRMARRYLGQPPAQARHTAECLTCLMPGGRSNLYAQARMLIYQTRRGCR